MLTFFSLNCDFILYSVFSIINYNLILAMFFSSLIYVVVHKQKYVSALIQHHLVSVEWLNQWQSSSHLVIYCIKLIWLDPEVVCSDQSRTRRTDVGRGRRSFSQTACIVLLGSETHSASGQLSFSAKDRNMFLPHRETGQWTPHCTLLKRPVLPIGSPAVQTQPTNHQSDHHKYFY